MGYCKQCGAYIPDGQTGCLACGFDEAAGFGSAAAAQQTKKSRIDSETLKRQMEEQRARQREQSRQWAQQEAARRKTQQETDEESRARYTSPDPTSAPDISASTSRGMAIISYISFLCLIPLFGCKDDDYAQFHAKQGLVLFIFSLLIPILGSLTGFGWLFSIAQIYFIIKGISNAANGKKEPLPYIGTLFKF